MPKEHRRNGGAIGGLKIVFITLLFLILSFLTFCQVDTAGQSDTFALIPVIQLRGINRDLNKLEYVSRELIYLRSSAVACDSVIRSLELESSRLREMVESSDRIIRLYKKNESDYKKSLRRSRWRSSMIAVAGAGGVVALLLLR